MEQSVPTSSNTFWGTPFLEKGPPKITEGSPFDPYWPISRINPLHRPHCVVGRLRIGIKQSLKGTMTPLPSSHHPFFN